jgi:hypothetical protein
MSGDLVELTRGGRLAHVLCRLARSAFTGLVYVERDQDSLVISMREGRPVFVEDLGDEVSIPDMLLEQGLVTKEQYANIATRVLESLAENEDVAFCRVAVETRVLSQHQVDAEVERRIRGRLLRSVGYDHCRIELDDDPDAVSGVLEYPQDVGALIYMGVRTFFDDERVRELIGTAPEVYARLLRPISEMLEFFQLESEEAALLAHIQPDVPLGRTIDDKAPDALEGWQLVCMLLFAEALELADAPFAAPIEPSGVRNTKTMQASTARRDPSPGSQARMPAVSDEPPRAPTRPRMPAASQDQVPTATRPRLPVAREEQVGSATQPRMPAAREESSPGSARGRAPVPREDPHDRGSQGRSPLREEYVGSGPRARAPVPREDPDERGSRPRMPAAREEQVTRGPQAAAPSPRDERIASGSRYGMPAARDERAPSARMDARPTGPQSGERAPSSTLHGARAAGGPTQTAPSTAEGQPRAANLPPAAAPSAPAVGTGVERPRKRPARKLSTALRRLDRELKQVRAPVSAPTTAAAAAPQAGQSRANIEQLLRMRGSAHAQKQAPAKGDVSTGPDEFRLAQEALRDQQYGRAHEHLRKACDAEPSNEVYAMYCMWAAFRANVLPAEGINKLRTALRGRVSDDQYKGFAYYALGHLSLAEKKDDSAEKFFRKAIEIDKHNKDAERHLRIIELRRKTAAASAGAGKIFGIEIGIKKP